MDINKVVSTLKQRRVCVGLLVETFGLVPMLVFSVFVLSERFLNEKVNAIGLTERWMLIKEIRTHQDLGPWSKGHLGPWSKGHWSGIWIPRTEFEFHCVPDHGLGLRQVVYIVPQPRQWPPPRLAMRYWGGLHQQKYIENQLVKYLNENK